MKSLTIVAIGAAVLAVGLIGYNVVKDSAEEPSTAVPATSTSTEQSGSSAKPARAAGGNQPNNGGRGPGRSGRPAPLVVASAVSKSLINNRLKAVGNGTAQSSVSVVPLSGGILTDVLVSSGQRVEAGSILAKLDDEEQLIARDRAAREAAEAEADTLRLEKLFKTRTTTRVELNRSRAALDDARLALRDAELKLDRRTITAPIAGIVGFVSVDTGNYITAQTELVTIDDRSSLVVEFWVPEAFANQIRLEQQVKATALADPGTLYDGVINGIGSRIEPNSRTLPVQARFNNDNDLLRPGMSFELQLEFPGREYPAVNPLAIQWDSNGSFVWQIVDKQVKRVAARIIQRNPESVLVAADLEDGDEVVSEGVLVLRQGLSVRIDEPSENAEKGGQRKPAKPESATAKDGSKDS